MVGYMPGPRLGALRLPEWGRALRRAEELGVDHVGFGDHVSFFGGVGTDGLLHAAAGLAATERVPAVIGVYLLPLRHPTVVARQLADLAHLAPGRLVFGTGVGGEDRHEMEVCGVDPATRGRRMDECLEIVRGLLSGKAVDHDGDFFELADARITPSPDEPVPILVGGRSDAAVRRAGRLGDGWLGIWVSPRRFGAVVEQLEEEAEAAGRKEVDWLNAMNVWCGVADTVDAARDHVAPMMEGFYQLPFDRFERYTPYGPPEAIAEALAPYVEAGCRLFNLIICGDSVEAEADAVAEVGRLLRE